MGILLAFLPFAVFAIANNFIVTSTALILGAVTSAVLVGYGLGIKKQSAKILELGTLLIFLGLGLYTKLESARWSSIGVRLCVDSGLLIVVVASMAVRQPFTIQYAREQVPKEYWEHPEFLQSNYAITGAWATAFLLIVGADLLMFSVPSVPTAIGVAINVMALLGAVKFTTWYPERKAALGAS